MSGKPTSTVREEADGKGPTPWAPRRRPTSRGERARETDQEQFRNRAPTRLSIIGADRSAIGTLVERTTRFTMLPHLPRMAGYGIEPRVKNGPALAGYGAVAMKDAIATRMTTLPEQLRRSLTWDRGKELAQHAQLTIDTGIAVYFADPHCSWQRGTNENTNGLLRQYFPKGTDLSRWTADDIEAVAAALNARPRKVLDW